MFVVKNNSFFSFLIFLWLHMVSGGYSVVNRGYVIIRSFDMMKTEQLYFFPYISLVKHGYKW